MTTVRITDFRDPRLQVYRDLRGNNSSRELGLFIAEGSTVVQRLLESEFVTVSVLVSDKKWEGFAERIPVGVETYRISHDLICDLVGFNFHRGILACGRRRPSPDVGSLLHQAERRMTFIIAPHVIDPENVGALIRIGAAFGVDAVIFGDGCSDPFSRRVLRVSMANGLFTPIVETNDIAGVLTLLREREVRTFATVLDPNAMPLSSVEAPDRAALVFGNETHGLDERWADQCDQRVTIPMRGGTDSLNVSVAAGIFLFHFTRGRS